MKKLVHVIGFLFACVAFLGFCSIVIGIFKSTEMMRTASRIGIGLLSSFGIIISLFAMGYHAKRSF